MTMAGNLWKESALSGISENALIKVASLDGGIDPNDIAIPSITDEKIDLEFFEKIIESLQHSKYLSFTYRNKERVVAPYGLKNTQGFWYLIGQEKNGEIKVFKLIRIQSEIKISSAENGFTKPESFNIDSYLESDLKQRQRMAVLRIRSNKVNALRGRGVVKELTDDWDTLEIEFDDLNDFSQELLWFGDDLYAISPDDLRDEITNSLKRVING